MPKVDAVIFDMDGVLIDSEPLWQRAERQAFSEVGVELSSTDVLQTSGLRLDQVVEHWYREKPWNGATLEAVADAVLEKLMKSINEEGEGTAGSVAAIEFFASHRFPLAIASASYQNVIDTVVSKLGIADYFQVIHSAQFEKLGKPDPAVYVTTAKKLGVEPSRCLVFEDTLNGIRAAKAAGMICVAVREHMTSFEKAKELADYSLESFELLERAFWLKDLIE